MNTKTKVHYSRRDEQFWLQNGDDLEWFNSSLEAHDRARQIDIDNAVAVERAAIIYFLAERGVTWLGCKIEAGEHLS